MYKACNWHVFIFHPCSIHISNIFIVYMNVKQTICGCLIKNYSIACCISRIGRLITSYYSIVRTPWKCLFLIICIFIKFTSFLNSFLPCLFFCLICFILLLRSYCELSCSNLFFCHFYFSIKSQIIAVCEKYMLIIITIPILF